MIEPDFKVENDTVITECNLSDKEGCYEDVVIDDDNDDKRIKLYDVDDVFTVIINDEPLPLPSPTVVVELPLPLPSPTVVVVELPLPLPTPSVVVELPLPLPSPTVVVELPLPLPTPSVVVELPLPTPSVEPEKVVILENQRQKTHTRRAAAPPISADQYPSGTGSGNIIAYVRRSAEDRKGRPLASQFETINAYVNEQLIPLLASATRNEERQAVSKRLKADHIREYFIDNGISGTTDPEHREGLSKALALVRGNSNIHIVVYDVTRLARSIDVGASIKRALEISGATLHLAQSRMVVEGASADLFFGLNLQLAASERTNTITRIRSAFKHRPDWDPRRSFGWRFDGAGTTPEEIPEEQAVLAQIKILYEEGKRTVDIANTIQKSTGGRRWRGETPAPTTPPDESVSGSGAGAAKEEVLIPWRTTEIKFLATKHKWIWGGGKTNVDLIRETVDAEARGDTMEDFLKEHADEIYDGVKINRGMLKKHFISATPDWKQRAIALCRTWVKQEKHSIDDMAALLSQHVPRPGIEGGWPRQTTWRIVKIATELEERERQNSIIRS